MSQPLLCLTVGIALATALWCARALGEDLGEPTAAQANDPATTKEESVIRYAAVVQFTSGITERLDSRRMHSKLEFKSPLYEGDRFVAGDGALLKMVTRNDCVAVIYGPAQGLAPEMERHWRIRAPAARWICPQGAHDIVVLNGSRFTVGAEGVGGEFFLDGDRLLVLNGHVEAATTPGPLPTLVPLTLNAQKVWSRENPEPLPSASWRFNQKRKPPVESFAFAKPVDPPPPKPEARQTRWTFGPTGGSGSLNFDKGQIDQKNLSTEGARLQMQRKRGNGSLIALLEYATTETKGNYCQNGQCPDTSGRANFLNFQLGYRFNHDRWWSHFVRGGGGFNKVNVYASSREGNNFYSSNVDYEFYMLSLAYGVDAYYSPSWLPFGGIYGGFDFDVARSLGRGARSVKNENGNFSGDRPTIANEPWALTTFNLQLMLGLMLLF